MGKGDAYRAVNKRKYDEHYESINWSNKGGLPLCKLCNLPISVYELTTFNDKGTCHSGCVFAPGRDK